MCRIGCTSLIVALMIGIGIGIAVGLGTSWRLTPYPYNSSDPSDLKIEHQRDYIVHVSAAYAIDGDLNNAQRRLALLKLPQIATSVAGLGEWYASTEQNATITRALAELAYALGVQTVALAPFINTPTPTSTPTNTPTMTPRPTHTPFPSVTSTTAATPHPTVTPQIEYKLIKREHTACATGLKTDLIKILVVDAKRRELAGVGLKVSWDGNEEYIFTGLKPEISSGYADFAMESKSYRVEVADGVSEVAKNITKRATGEKCEGAGEDEAYHHLWRLVFQFLD